jgi:phosphoglucomutase
LPKNPIVLKTIVTTDLVKKIAKEHGVEIVEVLTGFKYIGEVISNLEKQGEKSRFLLGFEESYGYLSGAHVRDKDGVNAALIISQMAAYYKAQGVSLVDKMREIYARYGLYEHQLVSYTFEGASGN